ncbi:hypothetical protein VB735_20365 [Halotia wernerae UHCC 0503]|nr:hypothetical protein [Halotia wernerae UHCC 0503]
MAFVAFIGLTGDRSLYSTQGHLLDSDSHHFFVLAVGDNLWLTPGCSATSAYKSTLAAFDFHKLNRIIMAKVRSHFYVKVVIASLKSEFLDWHLASKGIAKSPLIC